MVRPPSESNHRVIYIKHQSGDTIAEMPQLSPQIENCIEISTTPDLVNQIEENRFASSSSNQVSAFFLHMVFKHIFNINLHLTQD